MSWEFYSLVKVISSQSVTLPICPFFSILSLTLPVTIFSFFISATQLWRKKVADVAKDYKDIKFAIADDEEYMASAMKDFGLDDTGEEFNIGCYKDGKKYGMPPMEEYDSDEIRDFLKKLQKGMVMLEPI